MQVMVNQQHLRQIVAFVHFVDHHKIIILAHPLFSEFER